MYYSKKRLLTFPVIAKKLKDSFMLDNTRRLGWNRMNIGLEGSDEETK
jgi:hypothetical protein